MIVASKSRLADRCTCSEGDNNEEIICRYLSGLADGLDCCQMRRISNYSKQGLSLLELGGDIYICPHALN